MTPTDLPWRWDYPWRHLPTMSARQRRRSRANRPRGTPGWESVREYRRATRHRVRMRLREHVRDHRHRTPEQL